MIFFQNDRYKEYWFSLATQARVQTSPVPLMSPWKRPRAKHERKRTHKDQTYSFSCVYACVRVFPVKINRRTSITTTFGYVWPTVHIWLCLAPVSPTSVHLKKMAEAVAVAVDEKFSQVVCNCRVLYDKECKDFKDKNKHERGLKLARKRTWRKVICFVIRP